MHAVEARRTLEEERETDLVILISFDIDGTLEVGDPPGVLTMAMVRCAREKGFLIGSCSDRPISAQRAIWGGHDIPIDFAVGKMMLPNVKAAFRADVYCHIGDREDLDKKYALAAGFEFFWPEEAILKSWFLSTGTPRPASPRPAPANEVRGEDVSKVLMPRSAWMPGV
jgi:hypothetical protein